MVKILEQLAEHQDTSTNSELLGRDIGPQDKKTLEKIVKNFAPKLGLHLAGQMVGPTPVLAAGLAADLIGKMQKEGR